MRLLLPIVALLVVLAGCGGAERAEIASPPPPLTYAPLTGGVPAWLEHVETGRRGRWVGAVASPDGKTLLAQWQAECEIPLAYFVSVGTREPRPIADGLETAAVGWSSDGRAGVVYFKGVCGAGDARPGLYLVALDGSREFVTADVDEVARWQADPS